MAGWESPQSVQWTRGCSISLKQVKIQINIRQVTYHCEGLDEAAIPDTFLQPPLNYSPLHSIFEENSSAKLSIPSLGSEWDFMDGHYDDFSLLDWTPASIVHLPQHSDPQMKPLLDNASRCSFPSPVNASSNPMILQTDVDFDDMLDLKDLNIFEWTTISDVHPHEKPDTVLQPLGYKSCYMYNSLEDVDLNYLWHNTDMKMQQTSVNVTPTCSNLLLSFEHESITAPVSVHMDKPEGEPLLPGTSERGIYHLQTPGMPSNCTQPFQMTGSCNHPRVANVNPGQFGELHRHGRTLRDVVNSRVSPPLYGSAQYSQAWAVNPNINRQPVPTANRLLLNMLHPQEIQAGSTSIQGQSLLLNSVPTGLIGNPPMKGKMVAGVTRAAAHSAPQNAEVMILEEIQHIKSQKSADPGATCEKFNQVPHHLHLPMLINTLPQRSMSAVNGGHLYTNVLSGSGGQSASGSISGGMYMNEGIQLLQQIPQIVDYLQLAPDILANYKQKFNLERPCNPLQVGNMNCKQFRGQLPQGWIPLQMVNSCVPTLCYGPGPPKSLPRSNTHMLKKSHPDAILVEDTRTQGQLDPLNNSSAGSTSNQANIGNLLTGASTTAVHQDPHKGELFILEENQHRKSQKSEDSMITDGDVNGVSDPVHQSLLGYSVKSAVNARQTQSTGTQPASKSVSSQGQLLPVTSETIIYMHEIHSIPPSFTEPYQIVAPIVHLHDANMKGTQLRKQLPQEGMLQHTLNPHASAPLFRPGPSRLTEVWPVNMNINHHKQQLSTGNRQVCSKPHPENIPAEDSLTQGQPVPYESVSTFSVSNQHTEEKLASVERSIPAHQATRKGERIKLERSQSAESQTSGAPAAADQKVETDSKDTGVLPGTIENCPTATSSTEKKAWTKQNGDKPRLFAQLEKEASVTAEPIKQTDVLSVAKTHLNMRMCESGAVQQEFGDKQEQGILMQKSGIPTTKVLGNNVCRQKPAQNINKMNIFGEKPLAHHSNHTVKSATKRKNSDSKRQAPKKMKTRDCALVTLLPKKQCITTGHEMCNSDMPPVNTTKDIEKPKRGNKRKRPCKTAEQPCFKYPRSDLVMHMLASVEVFHKLGDRGKGTKSTHVPKRHTLPVSP